MHFFIPFLLFLTFLAVSTNAGRILAGFPVDALSHLYSMAAYLEKLANDGHQVTILHTGHLKKAELAHSNISTYYVHMQSDQDVITFVNSFLWKTSSHAIEPPMVMTMGDAFVHQLLDENSDSVLDLLNTHWDLIIVEQLFNPITYALAAYHKREHRTPYLQYSSSHPLEADGMASGLGRSWASKMSLFVPIPASGCDTYKASNFRERIVAFLEHFADYFGHTFAHHWTFSGIRRFGIENFNIKSLRDQSSLYLSDHFRGFEAAPLAHDFRLTGAYCPKSGKLPKDLANFVEDPRSTGTIYLAFGSMVRWASAPAHIAESIFGALNQLTGYRILISSKGMPGGIKMGKHVRVLDWAPQVDILSHNKTKVFISHGGLKSVKEAICGRTPVLYVPLFAEQAHNAREMSRLGIASLLNKYTMNKDKVYRELKKLLENPRYQQRMDRFHSYFLDNPIPNLDLASHLTNRIIRRKGQNVWFGRKGQHIGWANWMFVWQAIPIFGLLYLLSGK